MTIRWLTDYSKEFLSKDYLLPNQTVEERIKIVGDNAEKILGIEGFSIKLQQYIANGWISLSTPIWTNFGTDRGLPISCFSSYVNDTVEDILSTSAEIGMMSKLGGGTSAYFGDVRPRGSAITNNGKSNGTFSFLELFQSVSNTISQGSSRRGYLAVYQDITHPDIEEWLGIRKEGNPIQQLTWGVCISSDWIKKMKEGDAEKRNLWAKVIQKRFETGLPYIFFKDNVNNGESTPEVYKNKSLIKASNLCVIGSERVPTSDGLLTVKELYDRGEELTLFDNTKIVTASPMRLIEKDAPVYKLTLENGITHTVTSYHKVKVYYGDNKYGMVECKDLKVDDKVCTQTNKGIFGKNSMQEEAFLLGLYQADGTQHKDSVMLDVWENDFDLIPEIETCFTNITNKYKSNIGVNNRVYEIAKFADCAVYHSTVKKKRLTSKSLKKALNFEKGYVPQWIWESDELTQWQYIRGLLYADGTVGLQESNQALQVSLSNINREFLEELQILFNNLGLNAKIAIMRKAGETLLPDGNGGHKYYETKDCWRLYFGDKNAALELEKYTGFLSRKNIIIEDREYRSNCKKSYKIKSIEYVGNEDVYCTTVNSNEHLWICNSVITSNCSEVCLPVNTEESFVCDLASLNDLYYEEWKDTDCVEVVTFLLDAVMTEFINKASKIKFMEKTVNFAKNHRALGIGRLGYHSYLQSKMIPFESLEARLHNVSIQKTIQSQALKASKKLAVMFGECEWTKGTGRRNTTLQAIAPTTSSAFILGQVSQSIEPYDSNYYIKDLAKGKFVIKNPYLQNLLIKKGKNTDEVWNSIMKEKGSVLHLDFLTDDEKLVFKTSREISQEEIIIQAAHRQKYIDQSQSLNLFITADTTAKEVNRLMLLAHDMGVKTLYYQHNISSASEFSRKFAHCISCE
jgi:ribonucleoside-diphosphate reductase alpha chain